MFGKVTLVSLILFGFLLFGITVKSFADTSAQFEQAKSDIISLIQGGNYTQAKVQTRELIADFPESPVLPEALYGIAERYRWADKYEDAKRLHKQIIQKYPNSTYATDAQFGLSRAHVLSLIVSQNYDGAEEALDKMIVDFSNHPDLPEGLYWVARKYGWSERHVEERDIYQQILQDYPDSSFAGKAQLGFSRANVQSLIMLGDYDGAENALDQLITDFSTYPDLHDTLYWIAGRYEWSGRFEDAKSVHQLIIQNYPDSPSASKSNVGISRANVLSLMMSQDSNQAEESLDELVADFSGHPDLPTTLLSIGKRCYEEGLSKESEGLADQAKDRFEKAVKVWDRLINELPDSYLTPEACCWTGDCYLKLSKHQKSLQCFQKIVDNYPQYEYAWHAQVMVVRCYEELKKTGAVGRSVAEAQIRTAYERIIQDYPDCPATGYVRHLLSRQVKKEK